MAVVLISFKEHAMRLFGITLLSFYRSCTLHPHAPFLVYHNRHGRVSSSPVVLHVQGAKHLFLYDLWAVTLVYPLLPSP